MQSIGITSPQRQQGILYFGEPRGPLLALRAVIGQGPLLALRAGIGQGPLLAMWAGIRQVCNLQETSSATSKLTRRVRRAVEGWRVVFDPID